MDFRLRLLVPLALLLAACEPGPRYRGPVKPAPPGPVDAVRSLWGDYSGRCPDTYGYCDGDGGEAICCPLTARCCHDDLGARCCDADDRSGRSYDPYPPGDRSRGPYDRDPYDADQY